MKVLRRVVVVDARDLEAESRFWAGLLDGVVHRDEAWHSVVVAGEWVMGVQLAPDHVPPDWPEGPPARCVPAGGRRGRRRAVRGLRQSGRPPVLLRGAPVTGRCDDGRVGAGKVRVP